MNTKDVKTMTSVALSTATLVVLTFWSGSLEAVNETDALASKIATPKLASHGVEMTLAAADQRIFVAGDRPEFDLKAVNTTTEPASLSVRVAMTASSPSDAMSRVIRLPSVLWQTHETIALRASETKVVRLTAATNLPPGQMISVSLVPVNPAGAEAAIDKGRARADVLALSPGGGVAMLNFSTGQPARLSLAQAAPVANNR